MSEQDLELSVAKGVWATQRRNTAILNQAFSKTDNVGEIDGAFCRS
jgi:hypothetical protein